MRRPFLAVVAVVALLVPPIGSVAAAGVRPPDRAQAGGDLDVQALDGLSVDAAPLADEVLPVGLQLPEEVPADDGHGHHHAKDAGAVTFRSPSATETAAEGLTSEAGRCRGAFVSDPGPVPPPFVGRDVGGSMCSHGGDYVETVAPHSFAPPLAPGYASPGIPCYTTGPFVHVFYGYRSTGSNRISTLGPRIRETVSRIDDVYAHAAAQSGAVRHVRWLMLSCKLKITAVALPANLVDGELPGPIRSYLISHGLMSSAEKGLMFTDDGDFSCSGIAGIAEWADDERASSSNESNSGGMLARVFGWCWASVGLIDVAAEVGTHELSHTLGAVGDTAPHSSYRTGGRSHCTDGIDLMCYDDGGGEPSTTCAAAYPPTLDCKKDDYFNTGPPAGSYLATHWNPANNKFLASSAPTVFEVPPRPHATVTSPGAGVVAGTVNVTATATAASDGAAVQSVEFWIGTDEVGEDSTAPYTASMETIPNGFEGYPNGAVIKLVAVAVDSHGRTGPSSVLSMTVGNPKIRLTSPLAWASLPAGPVTWSAAASAGSGRTIAKVELLEWDTVIATDTTAPYGGSVALADDGLHVLRARVTDNFGVVRETVDRGVNRRSLGPVVTLISPAPFESVSAGTNRSQRLAATAVPEPGRTIAKVDFSVNGSIVATDTGAPYEVTWTPTVEDSYEIVATATDSSLDTGVSEPSFIGATGVPAGVSIGVTAPTNDASVSGTAPVPVTATPIVPTGWTINSVEIQVDGFGVGSVDGPSWSGSVDLSGYVGRHVLRAVMDAVKDDFTESAYLASQGTIIVFPGGLSIVAPAAGATLSGNVTVTGSVSGVDPNAAAPLYADLAGAYTVAFLNAPGLTDTFASEGYEDGTTTLQLSDSGFGLVSAPIAVTLKNAKSKVTAPAASAVIAGNTALKATASADGGNLVEQVRFFVDGVAVGSDSTSPYQVTWNVDGVANGAHVVRADAVLTDGRTIASSNVSVTLKVGAVTRLSGPDRYSTAAAISHATFGADVPVAYIATGLSFPDALAGAAAAGYAGGPLLLVPGTSIPASVATELTRLKPAKIIILGGTGAVSDGVKSALDPYTTGTVTRLSGPDRYSTAAAISHATFGADVPVAYIATGLSFPDALAGAAAAGYAGGPLLLVPGTSIPASVATELTRLKPAKIIILGGTGAVSDGVKSALDPYTTGTVTRLSGPDRYSTAAAISHATFGADVPVAYIATGLSFPDALAGAAAAGYAGGPLLLVPGTSIPASVATELTRLKPAKIIILGGTGAVSDGVKSALAAYVGP